MKKIITLLLFFAICFSLCACGSKEESVFAETTDVKQEEQFDYAEISKLTDDVFKECPTLPTPKNYAPAWQTSSSSISSGGKVTLVEYTFSLLSGGNNNININNIFATYIADLENLGFSIQNNTGIACDIYSDATKIASVSLSGNSIRFAIEPENKNDGQEDEQAVEQVLGMGDTISTDYITLTLDRYGSDTEIRSGTNKNGHYIYYYSESGDPYFYLYGTLKNLGGKPVDIRNIYVQFCFDGKYNYRGESDGVRDDYDGFINDVSPLSSVNYYIYTAVPQELIDTYENCEVRIGFTQNFDYKNVDGNDLPKFEYCDDVFCVEIEE